MTARDQSHEPKPDYVGLIVRLRDYACDGHTPAELATWLHGQLAYIQGEALSTFTYVACLMKAFRLDAGTARQLLRRASFG
jgi:hypothetical protein